MAASRVFRSEHIRTHGRTCVLDVTFHGILVAVLFVVSFTYISAPTSTTDLSADAAARPKDSSPREIAANLALGFQKILTLSTGPSWRTRGINTVAAYTGLDIIPPHPIVLQELAEAFAKIGTDESVADHLPLGSSLAWLSHLDMIKHILLSDLDIAFQWRMMSTGTSRSRTRCAWSQTRSASSRTFRQTTRHRTVTAWIYSESAIAACRRRRERCASTARICSTLR